MKNISSRLMMAIFGIAAWANLSGNVLAQESRTLGQGAIVVRLCPATCVAVNGHGLKSGGKVTVYESKSGWVRVSNYLNRAQLVKSFGNSIARKPALWVASSQLVGGAAKESAETAKPAPAAAAATAASAATTSAKPASSQSRKLTTPTFRPGTTFAKAGDDAAKPAESEPTEAAAQEPETEAPAAAAVATTTEAKPIEQDDAPADGTRRLLTWEELQERLAKQAEEQRRLGDLSEAEKAARAKELADQAAREAEIRRSAEAAEAAKAAEAAQAEEAARVAETAAKEAEEAEAAEAARVAEAAKAAREAEAVAAAEVTKQAELAAAAKKKAQEDAAAKEAAEAAKAAEAAAAAAAAAEAEKATEAAAAAAAAEAANTQTSAAAVTEESIYNPIVSEPISIGPRPKKVTRALLDKRLSKLPGTKSGVKKEAVIALRHYALGLLQSGECKGIASGGPSAVPGMLYVTCTEDPGYLRQFPLKEETW
ncbi:MAG: hypothetical protein ABJH63_21195 [Rhizobiaceae bacterium]